MHDVGVDDVGKEEFPLIFSAMSSKLLLLPPPVCPDFYISSLLYIPILFLSLNTV